MAETHQEVVKVWIEPGCIVCDACETDSPDVFEVQEETCIVRPEALKADFTKPLTPSIVEAAEGCPVDVIKYDMLEVEGAEPWAGQEEAAAEGAAAGAEGPAKKAKSQGWKPPEGPPDPMWAGLLATARASGSRSAGGPAVSVRSANASAQAIAVAIGPDAPPDARNAAMVGSGFAVPGPTVADRIRGQATAMAGAAAMPRREFNKVLAVGWGAIAATCGTVGAALQSFMVPKVSKEPPSVFKAGPISDFVEPGVYEQFKGSQGVWLVHLADGKLVAVSTTCTHLGCIPNWLAADQKFKCPCHGSGFYVNGVNFEGPAPRPLERHKIGLDGDQVIVDKSVKFRQELSQWGLDGSYVNV